MNIEKVTIVAPTPMPFTIKEELNFDALYKNTELWLKTKLDGFVIGTANGEEAYVTQEEKYQATKIISEASKNSKLIIGGIDNPSIYGTLNQIEKFHDSGANHVRIRIPRSGNTVNYFEKISTESSLPVIVIHQNIGGSENSIKPKSSLAEPEEIGEICSMDNIVGYITDHSVRFEAIVRNHVPKNKYFWICNGSLIIHGVLIGANGACMAFGNIGSAAAHKIFEYIKNLGKLNIADTDLNYDTSKPIVQFDPSIVRGLEYYTGTVFEAETATESLFKTDLDKGYKNIKIGSIGGGGRYDKLVSRFLNDDYPATGISIGLDRLLLLLKDKNKEAINNNPVVICVFDNKNISKYNELLQKLRSANINSEIYSGDGNLKSQLKYADKRNSPAAILYGDDEIKSGVVTIKNLKKGKEASQKIKTRDDWKSGESAQIKVKIENLVDEIKKLL